MIKSEKQLLNVYFIKKVHNIQYYPILYLSFSRFINAHIHKTMQTTFVSLDNVKAMLQQLMSGWVNDVLHLQIPSSWTISSFYFMATLWIIDQMFALEDFWFLFIEAMRVWQEFLVRTFSIQSQSCKYCYVYLSMTDNKIIQHIMMFHSVHLWTDDHCNTCCSEATALPQCQKTNVKCQTTNDYKYSKSDSFPPPFISIVNWKMYKSYDLSQSWPQSILKFISGKRSSTL